MRTDDRTIRQRMIEYAPAKGSSPAEFPRGMRRAAFLSAVIVLASSALLYQNNIRANRPPEFTRGGPFPSQEPILGAIKLDAAPSSTPGLGTFHSSATLTAPANKTFSRPVAPGAFTFPAFGTYIYAMDGWEQATAFGRRNYPPQMQMTVHRPTDRSLRPDEVNFDLNFSADHEEREVVAYRANGISFTFEAGTITFGPGFTRSSEASYDPAMTQIPVPLREGAKVTGTSEARDPSTGIVSRTEDWTVEVLGQQIVDVLGKQTVTWVVRADRQSRPGSAEQDKRTRTYWFDPTRSIWVKWTESLEASQDFGPGAFDYQTQFTATLSALQPPPK